MMEEGLNRKQKDNIEYIGKELEGLTADLNGYIESATAVAVCNECLQKHIWCLIKLAEEGSVFFAPHAEFWERLGEWADNVSRNVLPIGDKETAKDIRAKARDFRRELTAFKFLTVHREPKKIASHNGYHESMAGHYGYH